MGASFFLYLDRSKSTKLGPSLIQGLIDGYGALWLHLLHFIAAFTFTHALLGFMLWWLTEPCLNRIIRSRSDVERSGLLVVLIAYLLLALQASRMFPHSLLGRSLEFSSSTAATVFLYILTGALGMFLLVGLIYRLGRGFRILQGRRTFAALALPAGVGLLAITAWMSHSNERQFPNTPERPHVILIGIDGWRLDALPQVMGRNDVMPNVSAFIEQSVWFERTATPIARTYPAWWTILTGQFPTSHGVRFNLIPDSRIRTDLRLPAQLQRRGYYRMFAMDERRFANIRPSQGFDQVIGPAMGAADFVLGSFADSPLSNILMNHQFSRYLFPFIAMNRAAYKTYDPSSFDRHLSRQIRKAPRRPLFLITHFELPHWPFRWATGPRGDRFFTDSGTDRAFYFEALNRTDLQFKHLLTTLTEAGILENAIVVLLSDHGESMSSGEIKWENSASGNSIPVPAGHGNSIIAPSQVLVPLAMRKYGDKPFKSGMRTGTASLADVYPTLVDLLDLPPQPADGDSLLPFIHDPSQSIPARPIPLETGFNTDSSEKGIFDTGRLLDEGAAYYDVLPDGRLQIRPESLDELILSKQRAILSGTRIFRPLMSSLGEESPADFFIGDIESGLFSVTSDIDEQDLTALKSAFCKHFASDGARVVEITCRRNQPP